MHQHGAAALNAAKTHCARGHEYTPANTYNYLGPNGKLCRQCRICRIASRESRRLDFVSPQRPALTPAQVRRLLDAVADGEATRPELMARFGITRAEFDEYTQANETQGAE